MDKKDEELKKHLEEDLKKRMENVEFNNYEEDLEVNKEETKEEFLNEKNNNKNMIIIILGIIVVILLIVLLIFIFSGGKKESDNKSNESEPNNQSENENNDNKNNDLAKLLTEEEYDYSKASIHFNKYIQIYSKDDKKLAIADLEGNIIFEGDPSFFIQENSDNSLYGVLTTGNEKGELDTTIIRIKDNKSTKVLQDKVSGLLYGKEKYNIIGAYKEDSNNDVIYILNGDSYNTLKLDNRSAYLYHLSQGEDKYVYGGKYLITYEAKKSEEFFDYGIYDVKAGKQVLNGTYEGLYHLHDDVFVANKDGKYGVINKDNKILLDFDYKVISYANGLYFVNKGDDIKLHILDSNFKNLNTEIEVPQLDTFKYVLCCASFNPFDISTFKNNAIVEVGFATDEIRSIYAVDKKGVVTSLGDGKINTIDNFLIKATNSDNFIYLYDANMKVQHKIDVGKKAIDLSNVTTYLGNTLIINNKNLYDLNTNKSKGTKSWYRRTSQEFEVRIDFKDNNGTVTVSSDGEIIKKLENVPIESFLKASNNGITITKDYFIYDAGGVIILKRIPKEASSNLFDFVGLF